jgi:hypothetical protein
VPKNYFQIYRISEIRINKKQFSLEKSHQTICFSMQTMYCKGVDQKPKDWAPQRFWDSLETFAVLTVHLAAWRGKELSVASGVENFPVASGVKQLPVVCGGE